MIDATLRVSILEEQAADPAVGVILLDVVLGYGAHADPAAPLSSAISDGLSGRGEGLSVVAFLCGTPGDPQGLDSQAEQLLAAGALVTRSNSQAARLALDAAGLA